MKLYPLDTGADASPGEYLFHEPTQQIVLCGRYDDAEDQIQALGGGRLLYDEVHNFKKIRLSSEERRDQRVGGCKKCKG
jgi:hypothetical protein